MYRRVVSAVLIRALEALMTAARAGAAEPRSLYGVVPHTGLAAADLDRMGRARSGRCGISPNWVVVDPAATAGDYNWSSIDPIADAARNGVEVLPFLYATPDWVAKGLDNHSCGRKCGVFAPKSKAALSAWRTFVGDAFDRDGLNGQSWTVNPSLPSLPIRAAGRSLNRPATVQP